MTFDFDVRINYHLFVQLQNGEITTSMFLTMCLLYRLSDWETGIVARTSAPGLRHLSNDSYAERTFQEALYQLDKMGWITTEHEPGSKKKYRVVIHNYKWTDDAGKTHLLNPKRIEGYAESWGKRCGDSSGDSSGEASGDSSAISSIKPTLKSNLKSTLKRRDKEGEKGNRRQELCDRCSEPITVCHCGRRCTECHQIECTCRYMAGIDDEVPVGKSVGGFEVEEDED